MFIIISRYNKNRYFLVKNDNVSRTVNALHFILVKSIILYLFSYLLLKETYFQDCFFVVMKSKYLPN